MRGDAGFHPAPRLGTESPDPVANAAVEVVGNWRRKCLRRMILSLTGLHRKYLRCLSRLHLGQAKFRALLGVRGHKDPASQGDWVEGEFRAEGAKEGGGKGTAAFELVLSRPP